MGRRVAHSAALVGLPLRADGTQHAEFMATVLSELSPSSTIISSLPSVALRAVGFEGDVQQPDVVTRFLLTTLQTHRILQAAHTVPCAAPRDERLTAALSRMAACYELPPPSRGEQLSFGERDVVQLVKLLVARVRADSVHRHRLGQPLVDGALSDAQRVEAQCVTSALLREHRLRRNMLLTRLGVTLAAFERSIGQEHQRRLPFEALRLRATRLREQRVHEHEVSLYEAVAARQWLLADPPVARSACASDVKSFLMGQVPDRGGRISHAGAMPQFRQRVAPEGRHASARGKGKYKYKGNKNKRNA